MQEERAYANRLQAAYRRCFALAQEKHAAGEHETAAELRMKVGRWEGACCLEHVHACIGYRLMASMGSNT